MTVASSIAVTPERARRFLVRRHLLDPPRSLPADPESVLRVVERLGFLQFDPLEVPGARNHDLVLHARIASYRREWCDRWLYGPPDERRLFEAYNKSLNILPLDELPFYRIVWDRGAERQDEGILARQGEVASAILGRIEREGPLSTAAFTEHTESVDWWWAPTRVSRAVLEALFTAGRVGISRRDGNRRFYDLVERLFPADVLARRVSLEESMRHKVVARARAAGLVSRRAMGEVLWWTGTLPERKAAVARLIEDGTLVSVSIEGIRGLRYVLAEERAALEAASAHDSDGVPGVAFLAPLDPVMWDRTQLREVFNFEYLWEVYVPEAKRRWGYYVLPILFGDRIVGRIEPRLDRKTRTLVVLGLNFEGGFEPPSEPGFVDAFADAVSAYRSFVGASRVTWPRGPGVNALARALKRVEGIAL